ncbi:MAG TPA: pyridoxal-phosphate dependent enzyme [Gaiellaceae bacterium]|nr:pyridoxal-phosphate dependent enzyme [Gaiellaceae bacterium]
MPSLALRCRVCEAGFAATALAACPVCDGPLDVAYDWRARRARRRELPARREDLWRYREALPFLPSDNLSQGRAPGWTPLVEAPRLSALCGVELLLKLETANPTRSFKDRLAATALAAAEALGLDAVCCVAGGYLGEAVAARAEAQRQRVVLLSPVEREREAELARRPAWGSIEGNLAPYAAEGAKTVAFEIAEQLDWELPDAVVAPIATGALFAKVAQGFAELAPLGLGSGRIPRMIGGQPGECPPLPSDPRHGDLALGAAHISGGSIQSVPHREIRRSRALLADRAGVFADSAGGVALGALRAAVGNGMLEPGARVVLVVSGTPAATRAPETGAVAL